MPPTTTTHPALSHWGQAMGLPPARNRQATHSVRMIRIVQTIRAARGLIIGRKLPPDPRRKKKKVFCIRYLIPLCPGRRRCGYGRQPCDLLRKRMGKHTQHSREPAAKAADSFIYNTRQGSLRPPPASHRSAWGHAWSRRGRNIHSPRWKCDLPWRQRTASGRRPCRRAA